MNFILRPQEGLRVASNWRGYRPLVLGDRRFRWVCAFADPWAVWFDTAEERRLRSPDRVLVRPEGDPSRLLSVCWAARESPVVTPGLVRACIEEAIQRGWPATVAALELAGDEVPLPSRTRAGQDDTPDRCT